MDFDYKKTINNLEGWKSYAADTFQNLQSLDEMAEQDEYIKSPDLNVKTVEDYEKEAAEAKKKEQEESEKNLKSSTSYASLRSSGSIGMEDIDDVWGNNATGSASAVNNSNNNSANNSVASSAERREDNKKEQKQTSSSIDVIDSIMGGSTINSNNMMADSLNMLKSKSKPLVEMNEWSLLDIPWQQQEKRKKQDSKTIEAMESNIESAFKKNTLEESTKSYTDNKKPKEPQISMLSVVADLMNEVTSTPPDKKQDDKTLKSTSSIEKSHTESNTVEAKKNYLFDLDDLIFSDDEEENDCKKSKNTSEDPLADIEGQISLQVIENDTTNNSKKKKKTIWYDVFEDDGNNTTSPLKPNEKLSIEHSMKAAAAAKNRPSSNTIQSVIQNIPILQTITNNPKVQMLTSTISKNLNRTSNNNRTTPTTYHYEATTSSSTTTNASDENITLSSASIMKEEDQLEWQRIRSQRNAHPIVTVYNHIKFFIKFAVDGFREYFVVFVTFFLAFYVYCYSRKKVI